MAEDEHPDSAVPETKPVATETVEPPSGDKALVLGKVGDKGFAIVRKRSDDAPLEAGVVRPMREGEPIHGELVSLTRATDEAPVFDVKVHYDGRPKPTTDTASTRKGPARVASEAFRDGWDAVFSARGQLPS